MILIDTSILIGYLKGIKGNPYNKLDGLIDQTAIDNNLLLFHNDKDFIQISQVIPDLKLL